MEEDSSRIFSIFFVLTGFAFMGAAIGNIGALKMELTIQGKQADYIRMCMCR